eukprot:4993369-Lingulodinium_polyedra.AAC.1
MGNCSQANGWIARGADARAWEWEGVIIIVTRPPARTSAGVGAGTIISIVCKESHHKSDHPFAPLRKQGITSLGNKPRARKEETSESTSMRSASIPPT